MHVLILFEYFREIIKKKTCKEKGLLAGVIKNIKKISDGKNRLPIQCVANRFNDSDAGS